MAVPEPSGKIPDLPLTLPRLILRGAALVALAGVLAWTLLGLARMSEDVDDELAGARALALLFERLATAAGQPDDELARRLLVQGVEPGATRHLEVVVRDATGRELLRAEPASELSPTVRVLLDRAESWFDPAPPFTVSWTLPRPDGGRWLVAVTSAPQSERAEALHLLLTGVAVLAAVALGTLAVMAWNTRRAFAPLSRLLAAIGEMGDGRGRHPGVQVLPPMPVAELETVARALRDLDGALERSQTQRQQLARQLMVLQEDERQRLAHELHDEFGQHLTALRADAAWLQRRLAGQPELAEVAAGMARQGEAVQQQVRAVLGRLRPPGLTDAPGLADLGQMLRGLCAAWPRGVAAPLACRLSLEDAHGAPLDWDAHAADHALSPAVVMALYRVSQEALTNIARHAGAREAVLALRVRPRPVGGLWLDWSVQDDGRGLGDPAEARERGSGLAGITQRLWALGAELQLQDLGPGTRLAARIECNGAAPGENPAHD
jgi:two-component system sensor histidine kinase UhpB